MRVFQIDAQQWNALFSNASLLMAAPETDEAAAAAAPKPYTRYVAQSKKSQAKTLPAMFAWLRRLGLKRRRR